MAGDERQRASGSRFRSDHAERLGEDRRHHRHVAQRDQVDQVAVLERAGEERARRRDPLELVAVVAEADDQGPHVAELPQGVEEDVNALVVEQLPEVEDGRPVAREPLREPFGVALVGNPLVRVTGVRRIAAELVEQRPERDLPVLGPKLVDVDAGRNLLDAVDVTDDVLEHLPDVRGADVDGRGGLQRLPPPHRQLGVATHRVLELGAVRLDREACSPLPLLPERRAAHGSRRRGRPAGRSRSAEAFASTYASRSAWVRSCNNRASRPS